MQKHEHVLLDKTTPLLSNLDMKENIALIQETHHKKSRIEAENEARAYLEKINLAHIADFRSNRCSKEELFYVMIIRALMCDIETIFIRSPLQLLETFGTLCEIINNIERLNNNKSIIILDTHTNFAHYKECGCTITK